MSLREVQYKEEKDGVWKPIPISNQVSFPISVDIELGISLDIEREEVEFVVEMPIGAHLALGYGAKTTHCDMLLFKADLDYSRVMDCYHHSGEVEYIDSQQDWTSEILDYGSRRTKMFKARRALDTGDPNDFMF
jgi:hypothetical protein